MIKIPARLKPAYKAAIRQGWIITRNKSGHLRWQPPNGPPVFTAHTPGTYNRAIENTISDLKRGGLIFNGH